MAQPGPRTVTPMRTFEWLLLFATVGSMLPRTNRLSQVGAVVVAVPLAIVLAIHLLVEGSRWQFLPVYAVAVAVILWRLLVGTRRRTRRRRRPWWYVTSGVSIVLVSGLLAWALPVPVLPAPDGPYDIGTTTWALTDQSRDDPYDDVDGAPRRLVAQAWYPSDGSGPVAPLIADARAFSAELAPSVGLPAFSLRHLALARGAARDNSPLLAAPDTGGWPVVIYSHGWTGFRNAQADLMEQLASQGFVVLALDHTYGASVTLVPDGEAIPLNPDALPDEEDVGAAVYDAAAELLEATFTGDVAFLLDEVAAGRVPDVLAGVAVDRVALTGHSTGGGAMVQLCISDPRCAAFVGFDPWVEPVPEDVLDVGLDVPFISIRSGAWVGNDNDGELRPFHERSSGARGIFSVPGTLHGDVTVQPFLSPLASLIGLRGDVDGATLHRGIIELTTTFLIAEFGGGEPVDLDNPPAPVQRDG